MGQVCYGPSCPGIADPENFSLSGLNYIHDDFFVHILLL